MKPLTSATGKLAFGGVATAVSLVLQLFGGAIGIGTYAAPILGYVCTALVLRLAGRRTALLHWLATGLLTLILCPDWELAVLYLCFFGWYPIAKPLLDRIPGRVLRWGVKLALFNGIQVLIWFITLQVLYDGALRSLPPIVLWLLAAFLVLWNLLLILMDLFLNRVVDRFVKKS